MINKIIMGDGNKVVQPAEKMVATTNAQSESSNFATSNEIMLFVNGLMDIFLSVIKIVFVFLF